MFSTRALQVKMVKTPRKRAVATPEPEAPLFNIDAEKIDTMTKNLAKVAVVTAAAITVLSTASKIAVKLTPTR